MACKYSKTCSFCILCACKKKKKKEEEGEKLDQPFQEEPFRLKAKLMWRNSMLLINSGSVKWRPRRHLIEGEVKEENRWGKKTQHSLGDRMESGNSVTNSYIGSNSNVCPWWKPLILMDPDVLSNVITSLGIFSREIELDDPFFRFLTSVDFINSME